MKNVRKELAILAALMVLVQFGTTPSWALVINDPNGGGGGVSEAFWGEDLPIVETAALDQCNFPEFYAKVVQSNTSTKLLEVAQVPTCGSGNSYYLYRLDLTSGTLSYEFGGPGGTGGKWISVQPQDNADYPVLVRQMDKILQKIKGRTNPFSNDSYTPTAYENASLIANYLEGSILRKFPQIYRVNHPAAVSPATSFNLDFQVTGDFSTFGSLVIDVWDGNYIIRSLQASPISADSKGRGLYRLTVPYSLVSGNAFYWSARIVVKSQINNSSMIVRDERPGFLGIEMADPYFSIPIQ